MKTIPTCHPDRKHGAFGLCVNCYLKQWRRTSTCNTVVNHSKIARNWEIKNPERSKEIRRNEYRRNRVKRLAQKKTYHYKYLYGITREIYQQMCLEQDNKCAICNRSKKLTVDHSHSTGIVRGLLCGTCNAAIGLFSDDLARLVNAIFYLTKSGTLSEPVPVEAVEHKTEGN